MRVLSSLSATPLRGVPPPFAKEDEHGYAYRYIRMKNVEFMCVQRRQDPVSVFMGVPTMYDYLLQHHASLPREEQAAAR